MPTFPTTVILIENFNTVTGILLNSLLVYIIRSFSGPHFCTYKHLLTSFAVAGLLLLFLHVLVDARTIVLGTIHGVVTDCYFCDRRITAVFLAFQSIPFELLVIHFLYRYWCVCRPHLIALFSRGRFLLFLLLIITVGIMTWSMIEEYERKFGKRIENAWIVFEHWTEDHFIINSFITISVLNVIMIFAMIVASTLAYLTFYHIKSSKKMSVQTHKLQRKLLIALCVQASIPAVFVYIPYLMALNISFLKLPTTIVHDSCVLLTTAYPVFDALAIILLIADYREGMMNLLWMKSTLEKPAETSIVSELPKSGV